MDFNINILKKYKVNTIMKFSDFLSEDITSNGSEEYITNIKDIKNTTLYNDLKITGQEHNDMLTCLIDGKFNFFRKIVDRDGSFPVNIIGGIVFFMRAGYDAKIILKMLKQLS